MKGEYYQACLVKSIRPGCRSFACALIVFSVGWGTSGFAGQAARSESSHGKALLTFRGNPVTVRHLTGISYHRGLALCRRAFLRWRLVRPAAGADISPIFSSKQWEIPLHHPGRTVYRRILQGVLDDYLRVRILNAVIRKYSPHLNHFIDQAKIPILARSEQRDIGDKRRLDLAAITGKWGPRSYREHFFKTFPGCKGDTGGGLRQVVAWIREDPAFFYSLYKAAPLRVGVGTPAPWMTMEIRASAEPWIVGTIMAEHRQRFLRLAAEKMGDWHFIVAYRVPAGPAGLGGLKMLVAATSNPSGPVATKVIGADRTLGLIGSPTALGPGKGWVGYISRVFNVPKSAILPGAFIKIAAPTRLLPSYLCLSQTGPSAASVATIARLKPGNFAFVLGEKYILMPAAREVLRDSRPMRGLKLPSARWLIQWLALPRSGSDYLGRPLPQVILRNPWRGP